MADLDEDGGATAQRIVSFDDLVAGAESGGSEIVSFDELVSSARPPLDPRDIAASPDRQAQAKRPYLGAVGYQNVVASRQGTTHPGRAGIAGSALSDGMAEAAAFFDSLSSSAEAPQRGAYRPPGAGVMWDVYGGSLSPTMTNARALGISVEAPSAAGEMKPLVGPQAGIGTVSEYLANIPGRTLRSARGQLRSAFGAAVGDERMIRKGEREIAAVETQRQASRPVTETVVGDWALQAGESIATLLAGAAAGAIFGAPTAGALTAFGATASGDIYGRLIEEGVDRRRAAAAAAAGGSLEALTELLPTSVVLKRLGGKDALRRAITDFVGKELGGEMANSFGSALAEEIAKDPGLSIGDAVRRAAQAVSDQAVDIAGVTATQAAMLGGAGAIVRRSRRGAGRGISGAAKEGAGVEAPNVEAERAVAEMQRQAQEREKAALAAKEGTEVDASERWATAKRAFVEEKNEDGSVVYVAPSGARITPEQWEEATPRVRQAWLEPEKKEPEKVTLTPEQILRAKPDETLVAKPAKETSERLESLREQRKQAVSEDVRKRLDAEIRAEEKAIELRHAAEEFARMAEEEPDPQRKALLWNAAANLVAPPAKREAVPAKGIKVSEIGVEEVGLAAGAEETSLEPTLPSDEEIVSIAERQREAETPELTDLPASKDGSLIRRIAETRKRIQELDAQAAALGDSSVAESSVKALAAKERRRLRDLVAAHELLRKEAETSDPEVREKLRTDAQRLLSKHEEQASASRKEKERKEKEPPSVERLSQSKLLQSVWKWDEQNGRRGISEKLMADIGVEEPTVKSSELVRTKSGKIVRRITPRKLKYRMGFGAGGELFTKRGKDVDGIIEAMSESGWLPSEMVMASRPDVRWQDVALDMLRREIENPGSVRPYDARGAEEEAERVAEDAAEIQRRQHYARVRLEAEQLGIETAGLSDEAVEDALNRAYESDWTGLAEKDLEDYERWKQENDLNARAASLAAMVRFASEIDERAVEDAAIRFENDEAGFINAIEEIINDALYKKAYEGGTDDAGTGVPEVAGEPARTSDLAADADVASTVEESAARGEQGIGAGIAGEGAEGGRQDEAAGKQRDAEAGRPAAVGAEGTAQATPDTAASTDEADKPAAKDDARRMGGGVSFAAVPPVAGVEAGKAVRREPVEQNRARMELDEYERSISELFGVEVRAIEVPVEAFATAGPKRLAGARAAKELFARYGSELRFFKIEGAKPSAGFRMRGSNRIWVNIDAPYPLAAVAGHEFGHWLDEHHHDLWQELADHVIKNADVDRYRQKLESVYGSWPKQSLSEATRQRAQRELVSDVLGDLFADASFHAQILRENPSLYRKIARAIKEFIDELLAAVLGKNEYPLESDKFVRDLQAVRSRAVQILSALGEKLDKEAELKDAIQAAMERLGLPGKVSDGEAMSFMAVVSPPSNISASLAEVSAVEAKLFDSFNRVAQLEDAYRKQVGVPLPDEASVRLAETLFHGRVQHRANKFELEYVRPLGDALKQLKKVGLTIRDADDYLMALHAPERNATLKQRDPQARDGLSGITDQNAKQILGSFGPDQIKVLESVRKQVRRVVDFRIDTLVDGGLITREAADYLRQRWPNYVPLKTIDTERKELGVGVGFEMWATDIRTAFGRTTRASTPIGFALSDAVRSIVRAEKARVERAIWRQANTPDLQEIIRPYDPKNPPRDVLRKKIDTKTGHVTEEIDPAKYDAHVMSLVINGEQRRVFIADETLRRQLARAGEFEDIGAFLSAVGGVTRTLGRMLTEWNPNWFLPNAVKDAISASIKSLGVKGLSTAELLAEIPRSWKHIVEHKMGLRTHGARLYDEFASVGGITGAYGIESPEDFLKKLVRRGADVGYLYGDRSVFDKMTDPLRAVLHGISVANEVVEYATRFAAYKAARKAGYSQDRAAQIAKEITVNFNRRGEAGRAFGSLYVFFNAALQGVYGTMNFFGVGRGVIKPGSIEHKKVIAGATALAVTGAAMQAVNEFVGGDDEETGDKIVNGHADFTLDHNISLVGIGEKGVGIAKIPLPPEYSAFYAFGRRVYRAASQGNYVKEAAGIAGNFIDSMLPVRVADETAAPIATFKAVLPSVLTPVAEIATNTNFLGASIIPEPMGSGPTPPYYTISRPSTSKLAKSISEAMNSLTGGDQVRPGWSQTVLGPLSSPEGMEHLARTYTGGLGQTVLQARNVLSAIAGGGGEELELAKLPVVPRFYSHRPPSFVERKYREIADAVQYEIRARNLGMEAKDTAALAVEQQYKNAERSLRPLYRRFREASEVGNRDEAKKIREHVIAIKSGVLKAYNEAAESK